MGFSSLDTKPCGYDSAWRITCSLSYSLHRYRPACSVRGANPCSPSVPQRRALEDARSAGTKAFWRGVYAYGLWCAWCTRSSRVRPSIIAVKFTHRTVVHARIPFQLASLPPLPAGSTTRLTLTDHHHTRSADTSYRHIRLSTPRCHKVPGAYILYARLVLL